MAGLAEIGGVLLARSQAEVEIASQNIANLATPGYRARRFFALSSLAGDEGPAGRGRNAPLVESVDFAPGKVMTTGNPLDVALLSDGFFKIRNGDQILVTRNGQFHVDADGRLVSAEGYPVQSASGDIVGISGVVQISSDGVISAGGNPVARLAVVQVQDLGRLLPAGGGLFAVQPGNFEQIAVPSVQQGAVEASNVTSATEMIAIMGSLRRAEGGQHLVQVYDDLMGRALTTFGQ